MIKLKNYFYIYRIEDTNSIVIYDDQGCSICNSKYNPNDIFESGNIIVCVGKNIEIFKYSPDNNNNID